MRKLLLLTAILFLLCGESGSQTFKFGGQLRLRATADENYALDSIGGSNHENLYNYRQRSRLYTQMNAGDVVGFFEIENNSRWGFRTNTPNTSTISPSQQDETGEIYINNVFVDFPVPLLSSIAPTFARVGRQYFQMGRGLVIDIDSDDAPDPLDGVRVYTRINRHIGFDLLYTVREEDKDKLYSNKNMFGAILNLNATRNHLLPDQRLHPYTIYERDRSHPDYQDNRMFSGIYMEGELPYFMNILNIDRIKYRFEFSHQYGSIDSSNGGKTNYNGNAGYFDFNIRRDFVGGLKFKLKGMYFISTGDDPNTKDIEVFRSSNQNFRPGELFGEEKIGNTAIMNIYPDNRFGRGGSNMQIMKGAIELNYRDITIEAEYFNYLANKVAAGVSNKLGNELDLTFEYQLTNQLTSHLTLARFYPGLFFGKNPRPANEVEFEIKLNI